MRKGFAMRFITAAAAGIVLSLAACVDVDMETTVLGPDEARVSGYMQVDRGMYDTMGASSEFCPEEEGGTIELTNAHVRCVISQTGSFEEIFEAAGEDTPSPTATDLGDGTVRVSFPLGDVAGEAQEMSADPNMVAMFRPMMEGHSIVLRISGAEIVSSNGTISDDGTSAMLEIVLTDLLDGPETIPETFEAVVRY
jgi:hypothetical protein